MYRRAFLLLAAVLVAPLVSGCENGTGPAASLLVTGQIQNNTGAPIPAGARVVVVWTVSSGSPDYAYVFGAGTIDPATGTFRIEFDQTPPVEALNVGALGVGFVVATTNQTLKDGDIITNSMPEVIGITGQHAVIYLKSQQDAMTFRDWVAEFSTGYSVGVGVPVQGSFDKFVPVSPSAAVLILDDLANIDIVNWT